MNKLYLGIDIGGTTIKMAFIDHEGKIHDKWQIPTDTAENGVRMMVDLAASVNKKMIEHNLSFKDFVGIGVGSPGAVNHQLGIVDHSGNLGWEYFPLKAKLEEVFPLPVFIENDANLAALGEMWQGIDDDISDLVMITLGTGVGGGVIVNNQIVTGKGAGGEIGHMRILLDDSVSCSCGQTGCLEALTSATGIARMGAEFAQQYPDSSLNNYERLTSKKVFREAAAGDEAAKQLVDRVAYYLGIALANVGNILNPEFILLGGGVSKAGDQLLAPVTAYFKKFAFKAVAKSTQIGLANLGNDAGVIGAAYLAKSCTEN